MSIFQIGETVSLQTAYGGKIGYGVITSNIGNNSYEVWVYQTSNHQTDYYTLAHEKTLTAHNPYQAK